MERSLIVESRYARYCIPKFQAEFGVAEEEPHYPGIGLTKGLGKHLPPPPVPHPRWLPR